eukprot:7634339-Pyramimonas_sp.AAC.1
MERAMKITKDSAPGVDGLMGKLFRAQPKTLAAAYHPLAAKFACAGVEPAQWKLGFYRHHHKKKQAEECGNH